MRPRLYPHRPHPRWVPLIQRSIHPRWHGSSSSRRQSRRRRRNDLGAGIRRNRNRPRRLSSRRRRGRSSSRRHRRRRRLGSSRRLRLRTRRHRRRSRSRRWRSHRRRRNILTNRRIHQHFQIALQLRLIVVTTNKPDKSLPTLRVHTAVPIPELTEHLRLVRLQPHQKLGTLRTPTPHPPRISLIPALSDRTSPNPRTQPTLKNLLEIHAPTIHAALCYSPQTGPPKPASPCQRRSPVRGASAPTPKTKGAGQSKTWPLELTAEPC